MLSAISAYLVIMPKKADIHIQNTAPGPPETIAVATPTILPVPVVAASAVASAWKGEMEFLSRAAPVPPFRTNSDPIVRRSHSPNFRS